MKKIFTLIAVALMTLGVSADTLIDFAQSQETGIKVSGTTTIDAVKIKTNTTSIPGIKFANSYTTEALVNDNYVELSVEGGFKAGDVIKIAGAFNNSDESKKSAVDIFTFGDDKKPTVLFTTQQFINGRLVDDDPVVEEYTLTADADKLYLGRNGNTGTIITTLKVIRGEESTIGGGGGGGEEPATSGVLDFPTSKDGITVSGSTTIDAVKIKTNTTSIPGIKFANSYTTETLVNDNYAELSVEGGFKAGDVIKIAGAFNNSDETKKSAIDIFTFGDDKKPTVLFTTQQFINGRLVDDDPVVEEYTLSADADKLYICRNGNTATFVTLLVLVRGGAPVEGEIWTVAGVKPVLDNGWDPSDVNAEMKTTDGVNYTYVKEDIVLEKGTNYEFKIVKGHTWDEAYPSQNYSFTVEETAKYKVTISFNSETKDIAVKAEKTGDAQASEHTYSVIGTINGSWDADTDMTKGNDGLYTAAFENVKAGKYEFKVRVDHDWSVAFPSSNYVLEVESDGSTVTITFNEETKEVNATVTSSAGIQDVKVLNNASAIFNLAGQQVDANYKGVVIMNGKKMIQK
jgi:hypothetical protein